MNINLPSRYEDLDTAYKGRLAPNQDLITLVDRAYKSMKISGGIRFLPLFGESGSGKSSASRELSTHMPSVISTVLERPEIETFEALVEKIKFLNKTEPNKLIVAVIDQYEENVQGKERIPTQFVEHLSLLDRGDCKNIPVVFIWLTTSEQFRDMLAAATSRNKRILISNNFEIKGPDSKSWARIIEETFSFHNMEKPLSDYQIIRDDIEELAIRSSTIGETIEKVAEKLGEGIDGLQNLSEYQVTLLWPVSDGLRNQRVMQFSKPRDEYRLNWEAWYIELNDEDKRTLPLHELNRARLYFDFRVIPIRAADLHKLCLELDRDDRPLAKTFLDRFKNTHFFHIVSGNWQNYAYAPVRERESKRSDDAHAWYETVTSTPTALGKRIAKIITSCGLAAKHEVDIKTIYSSVRADIYIENTEANKLKRIIELKAFSAENTMPSTIKEQIKITLRRHAQLAGFLQRQ
ncbi:ATP-binding protein [Pseudomonas lalucatii]|uniref:ATP-binding protein n=1 Tax=Pseudomonas lalucatii TaxID=1424203 RepID=A0ABS5Q3Q8_9PSED|nr:hypothetical protein [Pseudomonas lalucatii]MBS7663163.1 ATP-binding protein [Pseudomonas lalucatii]QVM87165.1 ATP-binding protein [Pseudomonas lalucatii]